jgi:hypothetical protein
MKDGVVGGLPFRHVHPSFLLVDLSFGDDGVRTPFTDQAGRICSRFGD